MICRERITFIEFLQYVEIHPQLRQNILKKLKKIETDLNFDFSNLDVIECKYFGVYFLKTNFKLWYNYNLFWLYKINAKGIVSSIVIFDSLTDDERTIQDIIK